MEKRHFSRVEYRVHAVVTCNDESIQTDVKNLSLKGMLVCSDRQLPLGKKADITISLADVSPPIVIQLKGEVVRSQNGELGFNFERIELDSFIHLRNIVSICKGDADSVMDEFIDFVAHGHPAEASEKK